MRKILSLLLASIICIAAVFALSGCSLDALIEMLPDLSESPDFEKENKEPHVHAYGEWQTSVVPTCTTNGRETRYCECGETEERYTDPSDEHIFGISNRCSVCGEEYAYTDKLTFELSSDGEGYIVTSAPKKTSLTLPDRKSVV